MVGVESASAQRSVRIADDSRRARDSHRQAEVDELFAQWESEEAAQWQPTLEDVGKRK